MPSANAMDNLSKASILKDLQTDILRLQGFKSVGNSMLSVALGPINESFPNGTFPIGAVHEFISSCIEDGACTGGFVSALLSSLMGTGGAALWISSSRTLFPPSLKNFGISPERFIFIDLQKERDVLWAMEEALKCSALTAVIGEVRDIDFTSSRRLQLAVEQSQVTGFILRNSNHRFCKQTEKLSTTACVSRWRISSLPSVSIDNDLPGIGYPKWKVALLRMRNGKAGVWDLQWIDGRFVYAQDLLEDKHTLPLQWEEKKAG